MANQSRWSSDRADDYDLNWDRLIAEGKDPHGEVAFVMEYHPDTVLDAGCGTGRVAIELDRRGVSAVGVDLDGAMLDQARAKAPKLEWHHADLADLNLRGEAGPRHFDVVVMAGNVILFVAPGTEADVVASVGRHVAPGGVLITGFQLGRGVTVDDYEEFARRAGLEGEARFATWDKDPWGPSGDYVVMVHRRRDAAGDGSMR